MDAMMKETYDHNNIHGTTYNVHANVYFQMISTVKNSYSAPVVKIHLKHWPETAFLKCRLTELQISSYLLKLLDTIFKTPFHHLISIL